MTDVLLILATLILSAFFSGSELAFITANRLKLEIKARKNSYVERWISFFVKNPESFLSTTLVGNNIVNVLYATLMTLILTAPIASYHENIFGQAPSDALLLTYTTFFASVVIMVFGEVLPKAIFRVHADFMILIIAVPIRVANFLFKPLIFLADWLSKLLLNLFHSEDVTDEQVYQRQDIEMLMREIHNEGASDLDKEDSEILNNVLELNNTRLREVMIPRTEMDAVEIDTPVEEVLGLFIESGFSRLPVYDGTVDNIIGMVNAYDMFHGPKELKEVIKPIRIVPSSQRAQTLLSEFRKSSDSIAVVMDEYGGTAGLVTLEDILEEVVGDIQDEYDTDDYIMKKLRDGSYLLSAGVDIDELQEKFPELVFEDEELDDFETLAGFVINSLGRIPKTNEEVQIGNFKFVISKATPARIETVRLRIIE